MKKTVSILAVSFLILSILVVAACSFRPKPVTIRTYVIDSGDTLTSAIKSKANPYPYTLILLSTLGALPFRTQKILYRSSGITLAPYLYSRWEFSPTHMLTTKILRALDISNLFKAVSFRATGAKGNLYLECSLFDFSHHVDMARKSSYGVISAMFQLIDGRTRDIIAKKSFTIKKPAPELDAQGAASALKAASDALCLKLIAWLDETVNSIPATR